MAKKKNKYPKTFGAEYQVRIDFMNESGLWECNRLVTVAVPCSWDAVGKNLHNEAAKTVKEMYPKCQIKSVTYC